MIPHFFTVSLSLSKAGLLIKELLFRFHRLRQAQAGSILLQQYYN